VSFNDATDHLWILA